MKSIAALATSLAFLLFAPAAFAQCTGDDMLTTNPDGTTTCGSEPYTLDAWGVAVLDDPMILEAEDDWDTVEDTVFEERPYATAELSQASEVFTFTGSNGTARATVNPGYTVRLSGNVPAAARAFGLPSGRQEMGVQAGAWVSGPDRNGNRIPDILESFSRQGTIIAMGTNGKATRIKVHSH